MNPSQQSTAARNIAKNQGNSNQGDFGIPIADDAKREAIQFGMAIAEASPLGDHVQSMLKWAQVAAIPIKAMVSLPEAVFRKGIGCLQISIFRSLFGLQTMFGVFYLLPLFLSNARVAKPSLLVPLGLAVCAGFAAWTHLMSWRREVRGELTYPRSRGNSRFKRFLPKFISERALYHFFEPASLVVLSILLSKVDVYFAGFLFVSGFGLFWLREMDRHIVRIDWLNKIAMRMEAEFHALVFKETEGAKLEAYEEMGLQRPPQVVVETAHKMNSIRSQSAKSILKSVMGKKDDPDLDNPAVAVPVPTS